VTKEVGIVASAHKSLIFCGAFAAFKRRVRCESQHCHLWRREPKGVMARFVSLMSDISCAPSPLLNHCLHTLFTQPRVVQ
jgi:hypothetical protein